MLHIQFIGNSLLEVKEVQMSFTATVVKFWYYDTLSWLKSRTGNYAEAPTQPMTDVERDWVVKNYLPRALPKPTVPTIERKSLQPAMA